MKINALEYLKHQHCQFRLSEHILSSAYPIIAQIMEEYADLHMNQANEVEQSSSNCNIPLVSNLLPCPFCGGKAETVKIGGTYTTMCMNEECRVMVDTEGESIEESECNWNTRAR